MARLPSGVVRAWHGLESFAESRRAAPSLFVAALALYALVSIGVPLAAGRDLGNYLVVYSQLFQEHVVFPQPVLARTPGTPLVAGGLLDAGPLVAEAGAGLLYSASIVAWCSVARRVGPGVAVATAVALLAYPGYVLLFHRLSSDMLFAAGFAFLAVLVSRAAELPSAGRAAALGAGVVGLILLRPVSQALLLLVLLPLFLAPSWRARIRGTAAFAAAALIPLAALWAHNGVRLDDYAVVRGGGASVPLFRAFVVDRIVKPENGPASLELARAVRRDLLPNEPYRSYGIDLERFFSSGSARMQEDLVGLSDRTWGWDDDYSRLGRVGREAVLEHPGTYARGVARDFRRLLWWPLFVEVAAPGEAGAGDEESPVIFVDGRRLPRPTEGEPIPAARQSGFVSTPERRLREVWTSPTEHRLVYRDPEDAARGAAVFRKLDELLANFPDRDARPELAERLNQLSRWYPRPLVWLLVGLAAVAIRRPRRVGAPLVLSAAALLILLATALAVYAVAEYAVPVAPAFVVLAGAGVLGERRNAAAPS